MLDQSLKEDDSELVPSLKRTPQRPALGTTSTARFASWTLTPNRRLTSLKARTASRASTNPELTSRNAATTPVLANCGNRR